MKVEKRSLNWFPKQSAYDTMRAHQEKRRAAADEFITNQQNFANSFAGIQSDNMSSQGDLIAQAAAARLNIKI